MASRLLSALGQAAAYVAPHAYRVLAIMTGEDTAGFASWPTITSGTGAPSEAQPNGSLYVRTTGVLYIRTGGAWVEVSAASALALATSAAADAATALAAAAAALVADRSTETQLGTQEVVFTGAIPVTRSGTIRAGGACTIAAPDKPGIAIWITTSTDFGVDAVITAGAALDHGYGNTVCTVAAGGAVLLVSIENQGGACRWRVAGGWNVTLSGGTSHEPDMHSIRVLAGAVTGDSFSGSAGSIKTDRTFVSTEQTGNGALQNTAHGIPGSVRSWIVVSDSGALGYTAAPGAHDGTNCKWTVTNGVKYYVYAVMIG